MATKIDTVEKGKGLLQRFRAWKLTDAKARFSELVREAAREPQRVTVEGKDSVMVISAEMFSKLLPAAEQPNLHDLLSNSPLADLDFDFEGERSEVREIEL